MEKGCLPQRCSHSGKQPPIETFHTLPAFTTSIGTAALDPKRCCRQKIDVYKAILCWFCTFSLKGVYGWACKIVTLKANPLMAAESQQKGRTTLRIPAGQGIGVSNGFRPSGSGKLFARHGRQVGMGCCRSLIWIRYRQRREPPALTSVIVLK